MPIPCQHIEKLVQQIQPTKELLRNLDTEHPDVLKTHGINPIDYHRNLVFRSAIESIRGSFIASSMTGREGMVSDILTLAKRKELIHDYEHSGSRKRYDFVVFVDSERRIRSALEVKGGEGNSVNISERPAWADEFIM